MADRAEISTRARRRGVAGPGCGVTRAMTVHAMGTRTLVASLTGREADALFLPLDAIRIETDTRRAPLVVVQVTMPRAMADRLGIPDGAGR